MTLVGVEKVLAKALVMVFSYFCFIQSEILLILKIDLVFIQNVTYILIFYLYL